MVSSLKKTPTTNTYKTGRKKFSGVKYLDKRKSNIVNNAFLNKRTMPHLFSFMK